MEVACPINWLPTEMLQEVLSRLSWRQQLAVRRVSHRWKAAVDACLAHREKLYINIESLKVRPGTAINALKSMPNLQRLSIEPGFSSRGCSNLDSALLERICTSCPHLQEVRLYSDLDEAGMETLFRHLPDLRVLDLNCCGLKGGFLSRLPSVLESLTIRDLLDLKPAAIRQITLCPQLKQFRLNGVDGGMLETMLAACPQLELLSVEGFTPISDWYHALSHCRHLRDLRIGDVMDDVDEPAESGFQIIGVLTVCDRLERLSLKHGRLLELPPSVPGSTSQRQRFGLTHLEIGAKLDDSTFCRLTDLLPCLQYLKIRFDDSRTTLTERGLARGLRRLSCLREVELNHKIVLTPTGPLIDALSDLPLEKLSCYFDLKGETFVLGVAAVLRKCHKLALLCLPGNQLDSCESLANELAADPRVQNDPVSLVVCDPIPEDAVLLPGNVRVIKCSCPETYGY